MKKFNIVLMPQNVNRILNLHIPYFVLYIGIVFLSLFIAAFIFLARSYYSKVVDQIALSNLKEENRMLEEKLGAFDREIERLRGAMEYLVDTDTKLRIFADLTGVSEDVRKLGIGGTLPTEKMDSKLEEKVESISMRVDELLRQTEFQKESFSEIYSTLKSKKHLRDHTPSIRPCSGFFVSGFGYRRDPFTGQRKLHEGIDLAGRVGTPIYVTADGVVKYTGYKKGYGLTIIVDHRYGYSTKYGHLSRIKVRPGQRVMRGQIIGALGKSGRSTGPHLHYEVRVSNKATNPLNYIIPNVTYFD